MKLNDFIDGLLTLRQYYTDPNGYHIGSEHDQLYAYKTDKPLSETDVERMRALGWFQPDQDYDAPYDPENGWARSHDPNH